MWEISKIARKKRYDYAVLPQHPNANTRGCVPLHRVIMENYLGRLLTKEEVVHHINHDRHDNRIENLLLFPNSSEHNRMHGLERGHAMVLLQCPWCKKKFTLLKKNSFLVKKSAMGCNCCSPSCKGKLNIERRLGRLTPDLKKAIAQNVIMEYRDWSTEKIP